MPATEIASAVTASPADLTRDIAFGLPLASTEHFVERLQHELVSAVTALPHLATELHAAVATADELAMPALHAALSAGSILATFLALSALLTTKRTLATTERVPFVALVKLTGWTILPLVAAAIAGRFVLVLALGHGPGEAAVTVDMAVRMVYWLSAVTLLGIVFRPRLPQLRLVPLSENGARLAVRHGALILALGNLVAALLPAGERQGLAPSSQHAIELLAAMLLLGMTLRLLGRLKRLGLGTALHATGLWLTILLAGLWLWGWTLRDFDLYTGMKQTLAAILIALVFDRSIGLSILLSRQPSAMRLLLMLRVIVGAVAMAVVMRLVAQYWLVGTLSLIDQGQWPSFSRRLTAASLLLIVGAWLVVSIHVWIETKITPPEAEELPEDREVRQARLSTVLPIVRISLMAGVACIVSLIALSALGVDVTPIMAGAGILGLALSLGSQELVKDIVSGVSCMFDDMFRLGEAVEIGGIRGRVEQIRLRSIRVRGTDDRLHTIPFGEIGIVASDSRRLARVTIVVELALSPDEPTRERFARLASAALRSEGAIRSAIVGKINIKATMSDHSPAYLLSFEMARAMAARSERTIRQLIDETIEASELSPMARSVAIEISDAAVERETANRNA